MPAAFSFLRSRSARIVTGLLLVQCLLLYGFSRREHVPLMRPLTELPKASGGWQMVQESEVEEAVQEVLKADDTLSRVYVRPGAASAATLFVAFFKTQRTGQAPHSPKNCLPGAGWVPSASEILRLEVPGEGAPIEVNRYVVSKGDSKSVVMYWYQSHRRAIASEYKAKIYLVLDSILLNRSDTALVRVVVPVQENDVRQATVLGIEFIRALYPDVRRHLPA